ncbi:MAG: beta-lactamase family protein [Planctomycetes bacterium]|nr:beta-lactamase family protein [Planctomycetota bacterium]
MIRTARLISPILCVACAVLLMATAPQALAQRTLGPYKDVKQMPTGEIGQRITELIETVNANNPEKTRAFIESHFTDRFRNFAPMEQHLEVIGELYSQSRGFEFYGIRKYEAKTPPTEFVVILRNKLTQSWEAFVLKIEQEPPYKIAGFQFAPARPPSDLPPPKKLSDVEMAKALEAHMDRLVEADAFSGAVLLAKDGKVLFKQAYGLASKRFNVPNKTDTKFNLGSMNKMFTSVAILQLVERGKLSLEDPLSKFLSTDWLPQEITEKIRIKHLLTHTSGLGSYFNETYMNSAKALFRNLDDYKPLITDSTLAFDPGTDWQYSNTGMFLLGVVIEKATGQDYFDYIRDNVYKPAGMINTDCYEMDKPVPNLAMGYSKDASDDGPGWTNNLYKHVIRGGPAGGGFSTVEDLLRFDIALRSHKLLSAEFTELVWSAKPDLKSPDYGFGFGVSGTPENRIVGHSGGFSGISSKLDIYLDSGYTVAVMSNYDHGSHPVSSKAWEWITARK